MKARIVPEACIACGLCTDVCPAVFALRELEVVVIDEQVGPDEEEAVREAASGCPVEAIVIDESS